MEGFRLSNSFDKSMLIVFEPIGDTFLLPANDVLRIIPYEEGAGVGIDWLNIEFRNNSDEPCIVIWAETHKFLALYNGTQINAM